MNKCHDCSNQSTRVLWEFHLCNTCYERFLAESAASEAQITAVHCKNVEKSHQAWLNYVGIKAEDYGRVPTTEEQNRRS